MLAREVLLEDGTLPPGQLHQKSVDIVNAGAQAKGYDIILPLVTDEESIILRRGRNATVSRAPKSCSLEEYHKATALEALFGFLYLSQRNDRILELFDIINQPVPSTN